MSKSHPDLPEPKSVPDVARETFRAWERLRVLYLIILVPSAIAMVKLVEVDGSGVGGQTDNDTAITLVVGGLFANVCYLAGPLVEVYVSWLGFARRWLRPALFTAGTLLTLVLALLTLAVAA